MALVHSQVCQFTFTYIDDDGAKGSVSFNGRLPTLNQWSQDAIDQVKDNLSQLLAPLVDAALVGITATLVSYDDSMPVPDLGTDTENKGVWLLTTENNQKSDFAVPAIAEDKLINTGALAGIAIDLDDSEVGDFNDAMLEGIDLSPFSILDTVRFGTPRGEFFSVTRDAYKQNRASLKSRGRRG